MNKVLVIGSTNIDLLCSLSDTPNIGKTLFATKNKKALGGKGCNQAIMCSKHAKSTTFVSCVGRDENGNFAKEIIKENCLELVLLEVDDIDTGTAVVYTFNGDNMIILNKGANYALTPELLSKKLPDIKMFDVVLLQNEIPKDTILWAINECQKHDVKIIYNPAPRTEWSFEVAKNVDVVTPNEHELSVSEIGELVQSGVSVLQTRGEQGVYEYRKNEVVHHRTLKVSPVDTTGAGDAFNGILASYYGKIELKKVLKYANMGASLSTMFAGAQSGMFGLEQIEKNLMREN